MVAIRYADLTQVREPTTKMKRIKEKPKSSQSLQTARQMAFRSDHRQSTLGESSLLSCLSLSASSYLFFLLGGLPLMILSSVRAYIQGEDYWSKRTKRSGISLMQYASSSSQADFQSVPKCYPARPLR